MRVLIEGCSGAVSLAISICCRLGGLCECHCCSFLCIAAALWNNCSNRKSPHSWHQIVFQPGYSLLSSSRNSWYLRTSSTTPFKQLVVRVTTFAYSLKTAKLLYWRVTISSILQWCMTSVIIILVQKEQCGLNLHSLKQMLENTSPNLRTFREKCELHYHVPALWSIPPKGKPQKWAFQTRGPKQ